MTTEIRTGMKCDYKCALCGIDYSEQRQLGEAQFFTHCQKPECGGEFQLVSETEFTYEQELSLNENEIFSSILE